MGQWVVRGSELSLRFLWDTQKNDNIIQSVNYFISKLLCFLASLDKMYVSSSKACSDTSLSLFFPGHSSPSKA